MSAEVHTNKGRIDAVIKTEQHIYIFEFKLGTAQKALAQIEDKQYYVKYLTSSQKIVLVGVGFDIDKKNIKDYLVKLIQESH